MRSLLLLAIPALVGAQTVEPWQIILPFQASVILARDGSLIGEVGKEARFSVPLRSLPRYVPQAFVAVEDQRFYEHDGVDLKGVAAAIKDNLLGDRRGASTITQQLVGNMHPTIIDRRDASPLRKLREQSAAREMEKHYTKEQILEAYINQIEYGHGWYGIEMAARHYFGKPAARLTLSEAAALAGVINGPGVYDPLKHPDRTRTRRNLVLSLMASQGYITRAQATQAQNEPLVVAPNLGRSVVAPYFLDAARSAADAMGFDVSGGGFRVYTTIDPVLQRHATDALVKGVESVEMRENYKHPKMTALPRSSSDYLQGLVVAVDPFTGDVKALVGGRDFGRSPFNRATLAMRQPGSSVKPFVFARALEDSIPANSMQADSAIAIPMANGDVYSPDNADNQFMGPISMRDALVFSRNTVAVQLGLQVTMDSVVALTQRVGFDTPMMPYPSSAIGASEVRPVDFVAAYSVFATNGMAIDPRFVTRIEDRAGRNVYTAPAVEPRPAIDPRAAFIVRDILKDAAERGTGAAARRIVPPQIAIAGKTGTTNDNADVWFMGMTPTLVAGVWLGFDRPKTIMPGAGGGTLAAPIWANMIAGYYGTASAGDWPAPPDISYAELDRLTAQPADSLTPPERRYTEYFLPGTEPPLLRINPWKIPQWGPFITR
ncbi:MAG: transglycosylase domain-containing protein [Gemmatimonadaceae bacterium]